MCIYPIIGIMKPLNILMTIFIIPCLFSCVESKKTEEGSSASSTTAGKTFVGTKEIQVLNQVFEAQLKSIANDLLQGFDRFTGVSSLESNSFRNVSYLTSWCAPFKEQLVDESIDGVFTCSSNSCSSSTDKQVLEDCSGNSINYSCDSDTTTNRVDDLSTNIAIDYSSYDSTDNIIVSGDISGSVDGDDFDNKSFECDFTLTYSYGETTTLSCDNLSITCRLGSGDNQTLAYCQHILENDNIKATIESCE
jgi:hypothetical protein